MITTQSIVSAFIKSKHGLPTAKQFEATFEGEPFEDQNTSILFIDDRKENVDAARACGLQAIQFKNHKQLVRDLHKYNICNKYFIRIENFII